jgi:hypothetical protein
VVIKLIQIKLRKSFKFSSIIPLSPKTQQISFILRHRKQPQKYQTLLKSQKMSILIDIGTGVCDYRNGDRTSAWVSASVFPYQDVKIGRNLFYRHLRNTPLRQHPQAQLLHL